MDIGYLGSENAFRQHIVFWTIRVATVPSVLLSVYIQVLFSFYNLDIAPLRKRVDFSCFYDVYFYDYIIVLLVYQNVISWSQKAQRNRDKYRIYLRSRCSFARTKAVCTRRLLRVPYDFFVWYSVEFLIFFFVHQRKIISETVFGFLPFSKIFNFTFFEIFLGRRLQSRRVFPFVWRAISEEF